MDDDSTLLTKNINTDRQSRTAHIVSVGDLAGSVMFIDRDDDNKNNNTSQDKPESASLQQGEAKQRFDWRILLMPKLLMFCLSIVVFSMANAVIYATLPSLGKERGRSMTRGCNFSVCLVAQMLFSGICILRLLY